MNYRKFREAICRFALKEINDSIFLSLPYFPKTQDFKAAEYVQDTDRHSPNSDSDPI